MKYQQLNKTTCKYPEREICNYADDGSFKKCEFMTYKRDGSGFTRLKDLDSGMGGHWECTYKRKNNP